MRRNSVAASRCGHFSIHVGKLPPVPTPPALVAQWRGNGGSHSGGLMVRRSSPRCVRHMIPFGFGVGTTESIHSLLLCTTSSARGFHCSFHEPITPELITIESVEAVGVDSTARASKRSTTKSKVHITTTVVEPVAAAAQDTPTPAAPLGGSGGGGAAAAASTSLYTDVTTIDNFVKGKVVNFLRRMGVTQSTVFHVQRESLPPSSNGNNPANNNTTSSDSGSPALYRARVPLKLPSPHGGMFVAEGVGESAKDAESLAAMHAQHIVDALGIPLFALSSMQTKHAEAAQRAGRYAPMPGDEVRPVGTPVPSPFRMIRLDYASLSTRATSASGPTTAGGTKVDVVDAAPGKGGASSLFRGIMEAEVVDIAAQSVTETATTSEHTATTSGVHHRAIDDGEDSTATKAGRHPYSETCFLPWSSASRSGSATSGGGGTAASPTTKGNPNPTTTATSPAAARTHQPLFDPTENGMFSMVAVNSTRMSPSPDAILFSCVYDKGAMERLKDYFLAHGLDIKKQFHVSHVAVAGYSVRMYVAECRLAPGVTVIARGKAQDKDCAQHLAAMHAELLLDALGLRLFPKDDARQAKHADAVRGFGRWALRPGCVEGGASVPVALRDAPLPLPLKQQVGGDEVWLDPSATARRQRSFGERVIMAHHELHNIINDLVEVHPPHAMLTEARQLIQAWQRDVACNTSLPDAYVVTKMGEYYRASTLLPVPRALGVRGGTGIGRSIEQAIELAALHAVDTLCALGLPLCADPAREAAYIRERQAMGLLTKQYAASSPLTTAAAVGGGGEEGVVGAAAAATTPTTAGCVDSPPHFQSMLVTDNNGGGGAVGDDGNSGGEGGAATLEAAMTVLRSRHGYLPGYIIEGSQERMPPHVEDLLYALSLDPKTDFTCVTTTMVTTTAGASAGSASAGQSPQTTASKPPASAAASTVSTSAAAALPTTSDEDIIAFGNECRSNLQLYLQRVAKQRKTGRIAGDGGVLETYVFITGYASNQSVYNIAFLPLPLPSRRSASNSRGGGSPAPTTTPTATATTAADVSSSAAAAGGAAAAAQHHQRLRGEIIAVGLSLKKKDAERMCFVHASQLLLAHGEDITRERDILTAARQQQRGHQAAQPSNGTATAAVAPVARSGGEGHKEPANPVHLPSPVVHPAYLRLVALSASSTKPQHQRHPPQQRRGR